VTKSSEARGLSVGVDGVDDADRGMAADWAASCCCLSYSTNSLRDANTFYSRNKHQNTGHVTKCTQHGLLSHSQYTDLTLFLVLNSIFLHHFDFLHHFTYYVNQVLDNFCLRLKSKTLVSTKDKVTQNILITYVPDCTVLT